MNTNAVKIGDVSVGDTLPELPIPLTVSLIVSGALASRDYTPVHHDKAKAQQAGLGDGGYGMGVAVGDMDNDGDLDVFLANYGPDRLYRNNGDGTFDDVTDVSGIDNSAWAASAGFFDYDRDGPRDFFFPNYVGFRI